MRPTALVLNLCGRHCISYTITGTDTSNGVCSFPCGCLRTGMVSFLGGLITLDEHIYRQVPGVLLLFGGAGACLSA